MITQAELKNVLQYCPATGVFTWLVTKNQSAVAGEVAGSIETGRKGKSYRRVTVNGRRYQSHRLAILYMTGSFPSHGTGHHDGNGLNNKWDNLACETQAENCKNVRLNVRNNSGVCGVSWYPSYGNWRAVIYVNKKQISLGYHDDFTDAVIARKMAEYEHEFHRNHGSNRPL